jgi:hypothetical protein
MLTQFATGVPAWPSAKGYGSNADISFFIRKDPDFLTTAGQEPEV